MENYVEFVVYGDKALFSEVFTRVGGEKRSYHVPTYEAIKGVLHSIYWKPTLIWVVDAVRVMNPIQTKTEGVLLLKGSGGKDLSYYTYLSDVKYQVRAHFEWNMNRPELERDRNFAKHMSIAQRKIMQGGRRDVFLGTRECQAYVEPCQFGEGSGFYDFVPELSFGNMYHGITYADEAYSKETERKMTVRFDRITMKNGIINYTAPKNCAITRTIKEMKIKPFGKKYSNFSNVKEEVS